MSEPFGVYIHWPFCLSKCPYCDFNSHVRAAAIDQPRYTAAFEAEIASTAARIGARTVSTIFIGGGTPSLFSAASIERLLTAIRTRIVVDPEAEITMEANPGTFEVEKFRGYREAGVNRLSLGVQSFDDRALTAIGRVHGAGEARRALAAALEIFPTVNADLMYALPGQSLEAALADVREAIASGVAHVSAYHLTLEPDTHFHRFPPQLPDDDAAADMQEGIEALLRGAGYQHYETSAFARPGHRARHNLNYWTFGDYIGIGAGAHGKISFPDRIAREVRERKPATYLRSALEAQPVREVRTLVPEELPFEFMLNALRLIEGFPVPLFTQRTGLPITVIERQLNEAESAGLLARDHAAIRPTQKGQRFLNDLLEPFLPAQGASTRTIPINISSPGTSRPS